MTQEELQAIRERCNKATPFEWNAESIGSEGYIIRVNVRGGAQAMYDAVGFYGRIGSITGGRDWKELRANAEFLADARTDLPKALDEIERQAKKIERLQDALETLCNQYDARRGAFVFQHEYKCAGQEIEQARQALEGDV